MVGKPLKSRFLWSTPVTLQSGHIEKLFRQKKFLIENWFFKNWIFGGIWGAMTLIFGFSMVDYLLPTRFQRKRDLPVRGPSWSVLLVDLHIKS
jgi:hypothetical protein